MYDTVNLCSSHKIMKFLFGDLGKELIEMRVGGRCGPKISRRGGGASEVVSKKTSSMSRVSSLALSLAPIRFSPSMCKCHTIPTWQPFFLGRNFTLFCQNGGRTAQRTFETRAEMELSMYRLHLHINICQESHNCLN